MFENETKAIFKKYVRSKIFLKKLKNLIGPYDYRGVHYNSVFSVVVPSIAHFVGIEQEAHNELEYLLKRHNLQRYNGKYQAYSNNITVKEHIRAINKISIDTFYNNAFYYDVYNELMHKKPYDFGLRNCTYTEKSAGFDKMLLILDCIYLLNNPKPTNYEQYTAIRDALRKDKTFIFCGCKVTLYNNGRLDVVFSDSELFRKFEQKINEVIKQIKNEILESEEIAWN